MDDEDNLPSQFLVLNMKAVVYTAAEVCRGGEIKEGTQLKWPTVPWARRSMF